MTIILFIISTYLLAFVKVGSASLGGVISLKINQPLEASL